MNNKLKIFNDPVHGIVSFKFELLYDIIDHPYFQRLRWIRQMGMSNLVYPGANHTRFEHALGALHLMAKTLDILRTKGVEITDEEYLGNCIAILCHDIGHGPFSHALEYIIVPLSHEEISLMLLGKIKEDLGHATPFDIAIDIFKGLYKKKFLCQLVSSQLDIDRLDYLTRDSFYTGVIEGRVGSDRLIFMMNVVDGELVIEEKGILSVEKFLMSRHIMYHQVYLHKTAMAAEEMLKLLMRRIVHSVQQGNSIEGSHIFSELVNNIHLKKIDTYQAIIQYFTQIDDNDVMQIIKTNRKHDDFLIKLLSNSLQKRELFKVSLQHISFSAEELASQIKKISTHFGINENQASELCISVSSSLAIYSVDKNQIKILMNNGSVEEFSEISRTLPKDLLQTKICLVVPNLQVKRK